MNIEKTKKVWRKYLTRKDWRKRENSVPRSLKKRLRQVSNQKIRDYKGDVSDNGWYKKVFDLWWTLY